MSLDALKEAMTRLQASAAVYAALGVALDERLGGEHAESPMKPQVDALLRAAGVGDVLDGVSAEEARPMLADIRSVVLHLSKLLFRESRTPGWAHPEAAILQATGDVSCAFPSALKQRVAPRLEGLSERLAAPDARFLDVGVGVASLAIEMTHEWPSLRVTGIDPWAPSLALARQNVARAGLASRIELREQAGEQLDETDTYDLVWVPGAFIPERVIAQVVERAARAARPGGWVLYATANPGVDETTLALTRLRMAQWGGSLMSPPEAEQLLQRVGLIDVKTLPAPPTSVVAMIAGRRRA